MTPTPSYSAKSWTPPVPTDYLMCAKACGWTGTEATSAWTESSEVRAMDGPGPVRKVRRWHYLCPTCGAGARLITHLDRA